MLRAGVRTVKAAPALRAMTVVLVSLVVAGCFAHRYPGLLERHLEVLGLYADKLQTLAEDDRTVAAQDWGEFTYPLQRAREFEHVAASRYPERASLKAFQRALEAYAYLVADPAILSAPDAAADVAAKVTAFRAAATAAREALATER
ncbi:hypothetical protein K2Z84_20015 [Candidatus Binatia bacterium]|nr:hypothetical protein [Candidatus Binatia bacterium]